MNSELEREALKPCPFCGGAAEFERTGTSRHSCIVACTNCGARHESGDENGNSGRSWNARAALSTEAKAPADTVTLGLCHTCKGKGFEQGPHSTATACHACKGAGTAEAQPEVTGAVYTVPIEVENDEVLYRLQDHPEPRSDCGVLYPLSAIQAAVREKLEAAALIAEAYREVTDGQSMYIADKIRALMESPQPSKQEHDIPAFLRKGAD